MTVEATLQGIDRMNPKSTIYIAAPFFNPAQVECVETIETILTKHEYPFLSPRQHGPVLEGKVRTPEQAAEVYKTNVELMDKCSIILGVLDYLLPAEQEVRVVTPETRGDQAGLFEPASPPLSIPDTGTIWELGFGSGRRRNGRYTKLWGFTLRELKGMNLMISASLDQCFYSYEHLDSFFAQSVRKMETH